MMPGLDELMAKLKSDATLAERLEALIKYYNGACLSDKAMPGWFAEELLEAVKERDSLLKENGASHA